MGNNKYCRICWNTQNWQRPTGDARHYETGSYVTDKGFGHEEWLFNFDSLLNGYNPEDTHFYKYGFLQPINKYLEAFQGKIFSALLYTLSPERERLIIARINRLYVPEYPELDWALKQISNSGQLGEMQREVEVLRGKVDTSPFRNPISRDIINVRFLPQDVKFYDPHPIVVGDHKITRASRYQPLDWIDDFPPITNDLPPIAPPLTPEQDGDPTRSEALRTRAVIEGTTYEPRHIKLQNKLYRRLCAIHGFDSVGYEEGYVDLTVNTNNIVTLIEIKMELSAKRCIRMALGQLLEYAHYPISTRASRLLIVGDKLPEDEDKIYLKYLREQYCLPIYYARWDWDREELEDEI